MNAQLLHTIITLGGALVGTIVVGALLVRWTLR